jgi:choline dehydrogenase-like flavoprotein
MGIKRFDAVVIGSGAAGGAAAYMLTQAGLSVALVEKGRLIGREEFSKDELAYCRRDIVTPDLFEEYHVIETKTGGRWEATPTFESGWSFWNGNIVGGSSNFMSGMFHRMHPDDFRLLSKYGPIEGANIVDWPIGYDELEPYYTLAEKLAGISGAYKPHPFEPPRSVPDFPYPPTRENAIVKRLDAACRHLGYTPLVTPRAILSVDTKTRNGCYYSNFCGSYGCSSGAKGSSREAFIAPALATGRLTLLSSSHVTRLLSDARRVYAAEGVNTLTKKPLRLEAELFIVAAQAHESVRLLFNSANRHHPEGIGNRYGQLGKNLIFSGGGFGTGELHRDRLSAETFEAMMEPGWFVNRSLLDWYFIDDEWHGRMKGGLVEWMFEHQNIIARAIKGDETDEGELLWGEALGETILHRFTQQKRLRFEIFNDWLPTDDCFVTVDGTRRDIYGMPVGKLRIFGHPHDMKVGRYIAKKCERILHTMGARNITSVISSAPSQNLIAGGCRFGEDPRRSVLDSYCKVHETDNLYVIDASFMPTGGSVPYTWTIYANALRVGEYLGKRYGKMQKD